MNFSIFLHRKMNGALLILESWMLYFSECSLRFPGGSHYSLQTLQKVNTLIVFISPSYLWSGLWGNKQVNKFSSWFLTYSVMSNVPCLFIYRIYILFYYYISYISSSISHLYIIYRGTRWVSHFTSLMFPFSLLSIF